MDLALRDHDLFKVEISISNIMILIYSNHHKLLWSIGRDVKGSFLKSLSPRAVCIVRELNWEEGGQLELDRRSPPFCDSKVQGWLGPWRDWLRLWILVLLCVILIYS